MRDIIKVEVLFEKTNEDLMLISIASTALTQASVHNIAILNQN